MADTRRLNITKNMLWFVAGFGFVVILARLRHGLGAATALTDEMSWGLWIGFDVLGGVALAAGGFVIAGMVYIFRLEDFRPLARPSVLTAFIGYVAVIVGLTVDIGRPWMIWSPTINWQIHSALFEVAWCVMLYTTVLALEFAPVVLEKFSHFQGLLGIVKRVLIPLVILGIVLSTLHQSTLGALFVIMPFRVHPLWYTPWLPVFFLVSAVGLGLAIVIGESLVSGWLYERRLEQNLLTKIARGASYVVALYLLLVFVRLIFEGKLHLLVDGSWPSVLFWTEITISAIIPLVLFSSPRVRATSAGVGVGASLIVVGFVMNRINMTITSMIPATGGGYFPSWMEFAVSAGIVAGAVLVFFFFVEHCRVYEPTSSSAGNGDLERPVFHRSSQVWLGPHLIRHISVYFLCFLLGAGGAFAALPESALKGAVPLRSPVSGVRGLNPMIIDGDRAGLAVVFDHDRHIRENGKTQSCNVCHHMLKPMDEGTSCSECHRDMFLKTAIFNHRMHEKKFGGNRGCGKCHEEGRPKSPHSVRPCEGCHTTMAVKGSRIKIDTQGQERFRLAVGYEDAMHGLCVGCHEEKATEFKKKRVEAEGGEGGITSRTMTPEQVAKERLHFCTTCHGDLHYTNGPIRNIIIPKGGRDESRSFLFPLEMPGHRGDTALP